MDLKVKTSPYIIKVDALYCLSWLNINSLFQKINYSKSGAEKKTWSLYIYVYHFALW